MGLFNRIKSNKINKEVNDIRNKDIVELRKKIRILIVDDEKYDIYDILKNRGYNIYYKQDINSVIEVEPFDITIFDIKGVAKEFASTYEGFGFAKEVKSIYPNKKVICYSGTSDKRIMQEINKIDGFIDKDTDIDVWASRLDSYIKTYSSIDYQWSIIENQLYKKGLGKESVEELKKNYIKSIETESFVELKETFNLNIKDTKLYLEILNSIFSLIKIFL